MRCCFLQKSIRYKGTTCDQLYCMEQAGYENPYKQRLEYWKRVRSDESVPIMRCGYCDEQYPTFGEVKEVRCPVCEEGTPKVFFSEKEYLEALVIDAEDSVSFFSNDRKTERERAVCAAFLRCIGIEFGVDELTSGPHEPIDVAFCDAQFQVAEMLDAGRERHRELSAELSVRRRAVTVEETMKLHAAPRRVTRTPLLSAVSQALMSKEEKYARLYPTAHGTIDALVYVNLNAYLDRGSDDNHDAEATSNYWRSLSILFPPYAEVVAASGTAPGFIQERRGKVLSMWHRPGLFSV